MELLFGLFLLPNVVGIVLQIICAVHVLRNRKEFWWLFVILFFPFVGCIVYFIVEIYPDMRRGRPILGGSGGRPSKPSRRIKQLEEEIQYAETVRKRTELAEAYLEANLAAKAVEQYRHCLQGFHKDDCALQYGLARALFEVGEYPETAALLSKLREGEWRDYRRERVLLEARTLAQLGRNEEAEPLFREAVAQSPGEEARVRFADALEQQGRGAEAVELYRATLAKAKISDGAYRSRERPWIRRAKDRLDETG
jgi:hypothetical protein